MLKFQKKTPFGCRYNNISEYIGSHVYQMLGLDAQETLLWVPKKDNKYFLSPIFDNGFCLFPNMINEDEMKMVINDLEKINNRVYKFPTSQIKINNDKSSYFEVISSLKFKAINEVLIKSYPLIDLKKVFALIEEIDIISDIHKQFYKTMIQNRYDKIIKYSYEKLVGEKK